DSVGAIDTFEQQYLRLGAADNPNLPRRSLTLLQLNEPGKTIPPQIRRIAAAKTQGECDRLGGDRKSERRRSGERQRLIASGAPEKELRCSLRIKRHLRGEIR